MARKVSRDDWKHIHGRAKKEDGSCEYPFVKFEKGDNKAEIIEEVNKSGSYAEYVGVPNKYHALIAEYDERLDRLSMEIWQLDRLKDEVEELQDELGYDPMAREVGLPGTARKLERFDDNLGFLNLMLMAQFVINWLFLAEYLEIGWLWRIAGSGLAIWGWIWLAKQFFVPTDGRKPSR